MWTFWWGVGVGALGMFAFWMLVDMGLFWGGSVPELPDEDEE